ncbi:DMT family transporter [Amorphus coralli]|uniref:DMT family transporter n=1 Tax=Amorphus coralli TaxID=340680 RepID=UPI00041ACE59|nr:DMT family transporter [Amorphus coralli]
MSERGSGKPGGGLLVEWAIPSTFVLLWSTGYIGSKFGAPYAEPFTFLALRFAAVVAVMGIAILVTRAHFPDSRARIRDSVVIGMLMHGVYLGGVFWAIAHGMPAGVAALIVGLQPLMTAIAASVGLGERLSMRTLAALAVGLVGVGFVLGPRFTLSAGGITPATIVAVLISVVAISSATVYQKRFATDMNLWIGGLLQYAGGLAIALPVALLTETMVVDWTPTFILTLTWLVLVLSVGAVTLFMILIRAGAVSKLATLFYLVPAVTALMGFAFFGEDLLPLQIFGMALASLAVALAGRKS